MATDLKYLSGFGSYFESEALKGALPQGQNSPQKSPFGLYPEQLSGSAFTAPRKSNLRSWLYRIQPSVKQGQFEHLYHPHINTESKQEKTSPTQFRWKPHPMPKNPTDFIDGIIAMAQNGEVGLVGSKLYLYVANKSMEDRYFYSADGEFLIVPQQGSILCKTEFGDLQVNPCEIVVIPRGVKFQIHTEGEVRGYICENYGAPFELPNLGPIGANGLANPRDFLYPVAKYEEKPGDLKLLCKFQDNLWQAPIETSPCDVVAWHGNYAPYKYDLNLFQTVNTVSFDHPDPSIFTVLTSQTDTPGVANVDFVIFPPRWMVAENTFRPPYYHRNIMSEFMGLIHGAYDAKQEGFTPGGSSLHNCMSAHGPDAETFQTATHTDLKPSKIEKTMAFMFESCRVYSPTNYALETDTMDKSYLDCWKDLKPHFKK